MSSLKIFFSMISAVKYGNAVGKSHSLEWLFCLLLPVLLVGCSDEVGPRHLNGATMGTTWSLSYIEAPDQPAAQDIHSRVQGVLDSIEQSMSTYRPDSEINRYNSAAAGSWVSVSAPFLAVLQTALQVGEASNGAYDVTVAPLVTLWGFGPGEVQSEPPPPQQIENLLASVGQDRVQVRPRTGEVLQPGGISLDFSSLAKGYAVDEGAQWLRDNGVTRFLLEVGGEMRLSGLSGRNDPWRIAIEQPESAGRSMAGALDVSDMSVATSGDYRNYFEHDGQRFSHSIDPRSGYPVAHDLVSVTVVHHSAMLADAWATALTVLGARQALAVAQTQALAVYFIRREGQGFVHSHTEHILPYLVQTPSAIGSGGPQ